MNFSAQLEQLSQPSVTAILAYGILATYALHTLLVQAFGVDVPPIPVLLWNALVTATPSSLLLGPKSEQTVSATASQSNTFAAKSDALQAMFGIGALSSRSAALLSKLPTATEVIGGSNIARRKSDSHLSIVTSDVPAGLGNWDNSCYQNSVLQALSSLRSLRLWVESSRGPDVKDATTTTTSALADLMKQLRDPGNNGKHIWTPAKLKSMSSWQQQDAQEYFSKVMDALDNDAKGTSKLRTFKAGLESLNRTRDMRSNTIEQAREENRENPMPDHNPLEGWVAQRVACTQCGGSDGYSMIPFNCLTVPLGNLSQYSLEQCLDEYTKREDIDGVECRRCTLLQSQAKLQRMVTLANKTPQDPETPEVPRSFPSELRDQISRRLQAVDNALSKDDYSDKTFKEECQIPEKAYVSSTKTREAVIGRAPRALVVHINRSVFNEMTGTLSKNHARVQYPSEIDLRPWMLETGHTSVRYTLSAAVIHKGAHENGHYICYRRHPRALNLPIAEQITDVDEISRSKEGWYQLSDADVYDSSEADALNPRAGGVFMLFYERTEDDARTKRLDFDEDLITATLTALPADQENGLIYYSTGSNGADIARSDDDDTTTTGSQPPTVPPSEMSEVSEAETDLTDYDSPDTTMNLGIAKEPVLTEA